MQTFNQFKFQVGDTAMVMDVLSDTIKHIYKYRIYNDGKRLKPFYKKASRAQINQILELHRVDISIGADGILQYGRAHRNGIYY